MKKKIEKKIISYFLKIMGTYYVIYNITKKEIMTSYWKNCLPTKKEMKIFFIKNNWNLNNDLIYVVSYNKIYIWKNKNWTTLTDKIFIDISTFKVFNFNDKVEDTIIKVNSLNNCLWK